ncbi:TPA: helix-turn-helix transcriptional regulator [Streptococcus agalactiae]|nr:helix-turn-helix transcriptional regulator [Streptococcus agalactiae]
MKNRLKELRREKKLTQKEMAKELEVHYRSYQRWENEEVQLKPDKAQMLADYFGVHVPYLLGYIDENVEYDSDFVKITTAEFNDLWKARQELYDLKIALRILKNAIVFATKEEIEVEDDK